MLSRRLFNNCLICAGMGLVATEITPGAMAQTPPPGFTRDVLGKVELKGPAYDVLQMLVTVQPDFLIARHTHPGTESGVVLAGGGTLSVHGMADRILAVGDEYLVPPETPHALQNKGALTRIGATFTVERGKPLATPAPE